MNRRKKDKEDYSDIMINNSYKIPGPKAQKLILRSSECLSKTQLHYKVFSEYKGAYIKDVDGNFLLNFSDSTNPIGCGHPKIVKSIKNQMEKLMHISGAVALFEPYVELAEELKNILPYNNKKEIKIAYCVTGTEACDYAIQLARSFSNKNIILSYLGAFHGRTGNVLSITTSEAKLRSQGNLMMSNIIYLPYPYCYRCIFNKKELECDLDCLEYINAILKTAANPNDIAGIILEPIQVHGGVIVAPDKYLRLLRQICSEHGILMIDDEVYTGFCKTGKFFAIEHPGIEPDIVCLGKPMGGGMPIAAISAHKDLIDSWVLPYHGSLGSFAGHPLSCVAALTNIRILNKEKKIEYAEKIGNYILKSLKELSYEKELIGDIRGRGLLIGVELVKDHKSKKPAEDETKKIIRKAMNKGLIIGRSGIYGNVLKLTPPLIITKEDARKALDIMDEVLS